MTLIRTIILLSFLIPVSAHAALSSEDQQANDSTRQQGNTDSRLNGYSLVTLPSVNKSRVEAEYKRIRSEIPGAEIKEKTEEKVVYRLMVQCFETMKPAKQLQAELFKSSRTPFVIQTNNSYCVAASSQMTKKNALAEQKQLADKSVNARIVKVSLQLPHWQVKSANFQELRDAVYTANAMSLKGLVTVVEPLENGSTLMSKEVLNRL